MSDSTVDQYSNILGVPTRVESGLSGSILHMSTGFRLFVVNGSVWDLSFPVLPERKHMCRLEGEMRLDGTYSLFWSIADEDGSDRQPCRMIRYSEVIRMVAESESLRAISVL